MLCTPRTALSYASSPVAAVAGSKTFSANARRDFALIDRIREQQDEQAYRQLVGVYQKPLYHLVSRMVRQTDVAEDLTLEIFVRAFRFLPTFKPVFTFSTWLFRVATNYCRSYLRRRRLLTIPLQAETGEGESRYTCVEVPDEEPTPQEALVQAQCYERLHEAVAALPAKYRAVLQLHYFEELSYEEIAVLHQVPLGTVKVQLHRGRYLLQRTLAGERDGLTSNT
jgi:RNA polymerase sigma factor (sigma-70 family)